MAFKTSCVIIWSHYFQAFVPNINALLTQDKKKGFSIFVSFSIKMASSSTTTSWYCNTTNYQNDTNYFCYQSNQQQQQCWDYGLFSSLNTNLHNRSRFYKITGTFRHSWILIDPCLCWNTYTNTARPDISGSSISKKYFIKVQKSTRCPLFWQN